MEILAGDGFDAERVGEHALIVQEIALEAIAKSDGDATRECVVADAAAGVGPFAVPLTSANAAHFRKARILCQANDLNPVSCEYLRTNAKLNRRSRTTCTRGSSSTG